MTQNGGNEFKRVGNSSEIIKYELTGISTLTQEGQRTNKRFHCPSHTSARRTDSDGSGDCNNAACKKLLQDFLQQNVDNNLLGIRIVFKTLATSTATTNARVVSHGQR